MSDPTTLDQISSWLHIVSACIFLGGLVAWFAIVSPGLARVSDTADRAAAEGRARTCLRLVVAHGLVLLMITGFYQLVRFVGTQEGVLQRREGLVLMAKIMVAVLAFLLFLFAPYPKEGSEGRRTAAKLFYAGAALLAAVVILLSRYVR